MFRKLSFTALLLALPMLGFAHSEKVRLQLQELEFADDGIWYISREGMKCRTSSLHVDAAGYYASKQDESWTCPKCGNLNTKPYPRYPCARCRFPYDD